MTLPSSILIQCISPLARLCLCHGTRFQEILAALKSSLVAQSRRLLEEEGVTPNPTKISVMSGLQRPDVAKHSDTLAVTPKPSAISQIISTWMYGKRFTNKVGKPRVLSSSGRDSEFSRLVASVSKDLSPYTVLFEMERAGLIKHTDDGVQLITSVQFINHEIETGLNLLGKDLSDLTDSVLQNLTAPTPRNLHIRIEYDKIPSDKLHELKDELFRMIQKCLMEAQEVIRRYDIDTSDDKSHSDDTLATSRIALTVFSFDEPHSSQK